MVWNICFDRTEYGLCLRNNSYNVETKSDMSATSTVPRIPSHFGKDMRYFSALHIAPLF